jgi:diguanylate cyclase (GGDEF)-like protein
MIILTEPGRDDQIVSACEAGADDCHVIPYNPRVLMARVGTGWRAIQMRLELEREKEEVREHAARLAVVNRRLEETSFTDMLTGLPNRAYARMRLEQEWAAARRGRRPLSCMLIDIDCFKKVNDTYGHDVGDVVLQKTAEAMKHSVRLSDIVCRLGGEEFVLICRDTPLEGAVQVAERLRRTVEANVIRTPGFDSSVTISIGVATRTDDMSHPDELLKVADKLLYAAKHAGRNCIRAAGATYEERTPILARVFRKS